MKPVADPDPFATALDGFLVDLELKIDAEALVYAWIIDGRTRDVIARSYDPLLPGISGRLESNSKVLAEDGKLQRIAALGLTDRNLRLWQRETAAEFYFSTKVGETSYLLFLLFQRKPKSISRLEPEIRRLAKLIGSYQSPKSLRRQRRELLTVREREICDLLMRGMSNQEIADELELSVARVKQALSSVYVRLDVADRWELVKALS